VRLPEQQACPSRILISNEPKLLGPPADSTNQAALWKTSQGLMGEDMPTGGCEEIDFPDFIRVLFLKGNVSLDLSNRLEGILTRSFSDSGWLVSEKSIFSHRPDDQNNSRRDPTSFDWTGALTPVAAKPDRASYEAARRAELDHIRRLDVTYRQLLNYLRPQRIRGDDDLRNRDDPSRHDKEERDKAEHELYLSRRVLVCVVEVYLLGCVKYPDLTGEVALGRATSIDSLITILQAEEDLMIKTYGLSGWNAPRDIRHSSAVELALEVVDFKRDVKQGRH
jgi:hypothetical protein